MRQPHVNTRILQSATLEMWCEKRPPHFRYPTQFKKGTVTEAYSPHSILVNGVPNHIRDLRLQQISTPSDDDSSDKSSESDSNSLLVIREGPDDSSAEPEQKDSDDDNDDDKNESGQVSTSGEEIGRSHLS